MMTTVVMECKVCGCWVDVLVVPAVQWSCLSVCLFVCRSVGRDEMHRQLQSTRSSDTTLELR